MKTRFIQSEANAPKHMCKNGAALFCTFASPWRKTLQVACMTSVACTWGSLPKLCNWMYSTFTAPLSLTYILSLSCVQGLFSHSLIYRQPVCTDHVSTIWRLDDCQALVLQIHVIIIQEVKVKKMLWHHDMPSWMLNSLMSAWNGNYCSSWPFTTLLGRDCITWARCRISAVTVYLVHKILSASVRHHNKCQDAGDLWAPAF
jgi:hypothetical protein